MTCVIALENVMDTHTNLQFNLDLIAYFEWNKSMGIALKNARNKQKISLRNLAKKIKESTNTDITFTYIGDLEQGNADSVKKDKLLAMTNVLGITINDLCH
jgi:ribosome-binding protein aMBF1 (putative translation factor)